jgi:hypothetical protein
MYVCMCIYVYEHQRYTRSCHENSDFLSFKNCIMVIHAHTYTYIHTKKKHTYTHITKPLHKIPVMQIQIFIFQELHHGFLLDIHVHTYTHIHMHIHTVLSLCTRFLSCKFRFLSFRNCIMVFSSPYMYTHTHTYTCIYTPY